MKPTDYLDRGMSSFYIFTGFEFLFGMCTPDYDVCYQ